MTRITRRILPVVAGLALAAALPAANPYTPFKDPDSLPENRDVLWRGDQKHPKPTEGAPDERAQGVFHVSNLRWTFHPIAGQERRWDAIFTDARIDASKVTGVSLVWSPFFPRKLAGHAAMLLHFSEGGLSRRGEAPEGVDLTDTDSGVVISIEARMKDGEKYGFFKGLKGAFPLVYSFSTLENYRQRCIDVYKSELHKWKLALSPQEVRQVAEAALDITLEDHRSEIYKLTRRSCSTEFMDILIEGLKRSQASGHSPAREEKLDGLKKTLRRTRDSQVEVAEGEGKTVMQNVKGFFKKLHPARWLGITRDHVRRTTPHGILVNPLMSLPAQLPGVLKRRDLLESTKPFQITVFEGRVEAQAKKKQEKRKGVFGKLFGKGD